MILAGTNNIHNGNLLVPPLAHDVDGEQPAGTYTVETIDRTLDNLSFVAYRRVSTAIMLPAVGAAASQRQTIFIDPLELAVALKQDAQNRIASSDA